METTLIAYYSGTGGTQRASLLLFNNLADKGINSHILRIKSFENVEIPPHKKLIILFPIHDFSAPYAVYEWIERLPPVPNYLASVISISGGGEMICNTAARVGVIARLEKKGYQVKFEDTVVMPCNCIIETPPNISKLLLDLLPQKMSQLCDSISKEETHRTKPLKIDYHLARWGDSIKKRTGEFGSQIVVLESCNGCGLCALNCPSGNITIVNKKALFGNQCEMCLSCLYLCPMKALKPQTAKFMLLKQGFSIKEIEKKTPASFEQAPILLKGWIWKGVREYIKSLR